MEAIKYPKRLIEVDLPISRISAHARREKSIRHGHISTMHIWWARRPLGACRAILCAALWPDPADPLCPESFRKSAKQELTRWARDHASIASEVSWARLMSVQKDPSILSDAKQLRLCLLDFISDFANWDNSTNKAFLDTAMTLTASAQQNLGGTPDSKPIVIDPFSGGGTIPLEALRVGADTYASDLNPVSVILNKVLLEYAPKYGDLLTERIRHWSAWIEREAVKRLEHYYPSDDDGSTPVAYIWARTIKCEGPGCGATVPLLRSLWLRKKARANVALQYARSSSSNAITFDIVENPKSVQNGTVRRSSCNCPVCGYTTPAENVRNQFVRRNGGADDAQLVAVVLEGGRSSGKHFRAPTEKDYEAFRNASEELNRVSRNSKDDLSAVPHETLPYLRSIFNVNLLGVDEWGKLFNQRQLLALVTLVDLTKQAIESEAKGSDNSLAVAVGACLTLAVGRCADYWSSLAVWANDFVAHTFGRQALGIIWDYAEVNGFAGSTGSYGGAVEWITRVLDRESVALQGNAGQVGIASAAEHPLPDDCAQAFVTDPPYYDAVPYADLADFFYVWFRRILKDYLPDLFEAELTPKRGEIVQLAERNTDYAYKTKEYFEQLMTRAMAEGRRILEPQGIGVVVFAHKTTAGWETLLNAMIDAGWVITGSWTIDTERPGRLRANNSAALASSVHLVCRPRENPDGSLREGDVGDWREVLEELPKRIHSWMPRLAEEGVVGADAIFACLGPALEVFSRYSSVEKADGTTVPLRDYLEQVWAAVSKEALNMVFEGADASGFEEDARLTAMWLWTIAAGNGSNGADGDEPDLVRSSGYSLEFDTARKIAQGLGAHMEGLPHLVEIKGDQARLLAVAERTKHLFGKDEDTPSPKRRQKDQQSDLFAQLEEVEEETGWGVGTIPHSGETALDRVHQSMILFAAGRGEALKRFLVEEGAGGDPRFWRLAQALSALYPANTDEKRWVDGVLARKKSLGF